MSIITVCNYAMHGAVIQCPSVDGKHRAKKQNVTGPSNIADREKIRILDPLKPACIHMEDAARCP